MAGLIATRHLSNLGEQDLPREPVFIIRAPPGLEESGLYLSLQSCGEDLNHPTSTAYAKDRDATAFSDAGKPELIAQPQELNKKSRPCKGKRNRYKKLVLRLQADIKADPVSFDLNMLSLPPSLQANDEQRRRLQNRLEHFRLLANQGGC